MDDIRVRKALSLLLDRRAISDAEFGGKDTYNKYWFYAAPVGIYLKDYALSQEEISKLPGWRQPKDQDIAEAKKLLAEAGYPTGFKWVMDTNPASTGSLSGDGDGCPLVQGQFKRDYVDTKVLPDMKVECFPREGPLQFKANVEFDHEMSYWWSYAHEYDPGLQLHQIYSCNGSRNYTQGCDEKWTQMWEAQQKEVDPKKRAALLKALQLYTIEQYWTLLVWSYNQHVSAQPYVKGIQQWIGPFSGSSGDYYTSRLWLNK